MSHEEDSVNRASKLISQLLLEDTDLRGIVEEFVDGLGGRIDEMKSAFDAMNWTGLATLAHRLKGAGGSYGYPDLSAVAKTIEDNVKAQRTENLLAWMRELENLATAARAGLSQDSILGLADHSP